MLLTSSWGREHHSSKTANSNRTAVTALEPKQSKIASPESQRKGANFCLLHSLNCCCVIITYVVLLKSFWRVGYSGIFLMSSQSLSLVGGEKEKHLQFWKCRLSNTWEEITTAGVWLSVCWPMLLFHNCQHFQIHQTDSFFVPTQTTSHFL